MCDLTEVYEVLMHRTQGQGHLAMEKLKVLNEHLGRLKRGLSEEFKESVQVLYFEAQECTVLDHLLDYVIRLETMLLLLLLSEMNLTDTEQFKELGIGVLDDVLPVVMVRAFMGRAAKRRFCDFWNAFCAAEVFKRLSKWMPLYFKKVLFGHVGARDSQEFDRVDLDRLFTIVFSNYQGFQKVKQINDVAFSVYRLSDKAAAIPFGPVEIRVVTSPYKDELPKGTLFQVSSLGIVESHRYCEDQMVIFGKHEDNARFADIQLPSSEQINTVHALLINNDRKIHLVDSSERGNVGICLFEEYGDIPLQKGMRLRFSYKNFVVVGEIEYKHQLNETAEEQVRSYITFQYVSPRDRPKRLEAVENNQQFNVGRGGAGMSADLPMPQTDTTVSATQATIIYKDGGWYIKGNKRDNANYLLLKTQEEFEFNFPSKPLELFAEIPGSAALNGVTVIPKIDVLPIRKICMWNYEFSLKSS